MAAPVTSDHLRSARRAVDTATRRFGDLLSDVSDPAAMATKDWTVADTAAHVATIARLYTALVRGPGEKLPFDGLDGLRTATVDTVADLNEVMLGQFRERDPAAIAAALRADVADVLEVSAGAEPGEQVHWLGGARVPMAGLLAHLLNEIQLHGRDIARASGADWAIPPGDIGMFFELFVAGMTRNGLGHLLDSTAPPPRRRVAVEFRSRYMTPVTIVLQDRRVFVEEPGGDVDVRLTFDPPALSLMLFGRISKARALLSGRVVVRGRRPWLLPVFMRTVRFPG
ncbi:maleylpyruvate isomerase family mycothiol-dependent enzyme [Actinomadura decatromicini]|uniref:Maleylpyruvate isomerase family mycothiol-dependent enzyme n=1 Tax=Actinomadura decatromicini TaxID=2604572 RepID=A0A5D3FW85_9ACTN|nr:maleylpyruvate isomerase family mycothiol-dependent enzyme [Actinomadura decatromicini]TYK52493.1 maleylpyruvate isomerase family mycothiol-dependent enzyme [Actinomadura decatromicini]